MIESLIEDARYSLRMLANSPGCTAVAVLSLALMLSRVLKESMLLLGIGVVLGIPATLAATRLAQAQLSGLSPSDPVTLAVPVIIIIIAMVTLAAAYLPARRAMGVDPIVALRYEGRTEIPASVCGN